MLFPRAVKEIWKLLDIPPVLFRVFEKERERMLEKGEEEKRERKTFAALEPESVYPKNLQVHLHMLLYMSHTHTGVM